MSQYDDAHDDFPSLVDLEEEHLEQFNELRTHLCQGSKISASLLYGSFSEDHVFNYNVSIFVDDHEYKFCMAYIEDASIVSDLALAPYKEEAHEQIVDYIMSYINS